MTATHQARALLDLERRDGALPPLVLVAGGKGGVGKTLLAVNLALLCARSGYRTLLADLDPGLPNVDVHLRLAPRHTLEDLARGTCSSAEALVEGPFGLRVLAGRSGSTALTSGALLPAAHAALGRAARGFDLVVCDGGAGIGPAVVTAAERAATVITVTTPEPAAVTDAYALAKVLLGKHRPAPHLLVNQVRDREHALRTATRLSGVAERFLGARLPFLGWLRRDPAIERSTVEQRPFALRGADAAMEDLRALTATLLAETPGVRRSSGQPAAAGPA